MKVNYDCELGQIARFCSELSMKDTAAVNGGLQDFINRKGQNILNVYRPTYCCEIDHSSFSNLPVDIHLEILSYLPPRDLCRLSSVNSRWNVLCSDTMLWSKMLRRDVSKWPRITHLTNPDIYEDVKSDLPMKQIYLKCCPDTNELMKTEMYNLYQLSVLLRSFIQPALFYQRPPRIIMFGPGLRKPTSKIITNLMINAQMFKVIGTAPGEFQGIGSGLWVKVNKKYTINLIVLFPGPKKVRDNDAGNNSNNLFLVPEESGEGGRWTEPVERLARTADGLMFLVNGEETNVSCEENNVYARQQLFAMSRVLDKEVPLSVLSCVCAGARQTPCIEVCRRLNVKNLCHPWMVQDCVCCDADTALPAVEWLLSKTNRGLF